MIYFLNKMKEFKAYILLWNIVMLLREENYNYNLKMKKNKDCNNKNNNIYRWDKKD